MSFEVFTIGHSTKAIADFLGVLQKHSIDAVADVRSAPYSRHNPQFNREALQSALKEAKMKYVFLGKELGARSDEDCCYVNDKVSYSRLAQSDLFQSGIARVLEGASKHRVALMCAEKDPLDCHRTILVARELLKHGALVSHIHSDSTLEDHAASMSRLVARLGLSEGDMFRSHESTLEEAYELQGDAIAYDRRAHRRPNKSYELRSSGEHG